MRAYLRRGGVRRAARRLRRGSSARQLRCAGRGPPAGRAATARSVERAAARDALRAERARSERLTPTSMSLRARHRPCARRVEGRARARTSARWPAARCSTTPRRAARESGVIDRVVLIAPIRTRSPTPAAARVWTCRFCGPRRWPQDDTPMLPVVQHALETLAGESRGSRTSSCCCSRRRRCGDPTTCATRCDCCATRMPTRS